MTTVATSPDVLFERRIVAESTGCWRWSGPLNGAYPQLGWRVEGRKIRKPARVWAWERVHGPVPAGHLVTPACGNQLCVNPQHATVRTIADTRTAPLEHLAAQFWQKVDRSAGPDVCWPWLGFVDPASGYGRTKWAGESLGAHQAAFMVANGWRPRGRRQYVCHHCDNPVCCNPAHLYAGSPADNSADRERRGRSRPRRGASSPAAKLTADDVREIRRRHAAGGTSYPQLAAEFGLHPQNIGRVVRGEGYTDVA